MKRFMLLWRCSMAECRICYDAKLITYVTSVLKLSMKTADYHNGWFEVNQLVNTRAN